ncbi:MAG: hydrolase 2, exosortase A system-associated [Methylomarinum sp.]|nr:hydrolase 2, exosortase A system-associated [Methylomarinum sp.]
MIDTVSENILLQPQYINGSKGDLFTLFVPPKNNENTVFLLLPSFAEELNRCRVMVAMQARQLAAQGYGCLLLDYYGTGDSQGDFSETDYLQWHEDIDSAYQWLGSQGYENIALWGLRLGALLAVDNAVKYPERYSRLILWQPVLDAKLFLTQFLRIRIAMLMDRGLKKETTNEMRSTLEQGGSIEIAGYEITPQLFKTLELQKMMDYMVTDKMPVIDWFEVVLDEGNDLSLPSQRVLEKWSNHHDKVNVHTFTGPFFWQLHERELTPELLEKTNQAVARN